MNLWCGLFLGTLVFAIAKGEPPRHLVACEQSQHRVVVLDTEADGSKPEAIVWQWTARDDEGVDEAHHGWFSHPSDAKPASGGRILTVASGGGVAVLSIEKWEVLRYGRAGSNPHSVVELPGGFLLTASSTDNLLRLFPPGEEKLLEGVQDLELVDAHGLVWDAARTCVWALGGKQMKRLRFDRDAGSLADRETIALPVTDRSRRHARHGGHDLVWDPMRKRLVLSDMDDLWSFDPESGEFEALVPGPVPKVKSLAPDADRARFWMLQASEQWWSDTVRDLDGRERWRMPGARFYKVRWIRFQSGNSMRTK